MLVYVSLCNTLCSLIHTVSPAARPDTTLADGKTGTVKMERSDAFLSMLQSCLVNVRDSIDASLPGKAVCMMHVTVFEEEVCVCECGGLCVCPHDHISLSIYLSSLSITTHTRTH
jgi:hypothetical protein